MTVIISDGAQVRTLSPSLPWSNRAITTYAGPSGGNVSLWGGRSAIYEQIVFSQPWVYAAVRTFYLAVARALHDRRRDRHHLRGRAVCAEFRRHGLAAPGLVAVKCAAVASALDAALAAEFGDVL